jgi:hypothetical protein
MLHIILYHNSFTTASHIDVMPSGYFNHITQASATSYAGITVKFLFNTERRTHGRGEKSVQAFDGKARRKETTRKTEE